MQQLVDAENRDRESLYLEIAKANNFPKESVAKIKASSPKLGRTGAIRLVDSRRARELAEEMMQDGTLPIVPFPTLGIGAWR